MLMWIPRSAFEFPFRSSPKCPVQINVLPAGSDPAHPDVHPHHAPHPAAVHLNPVTSPDPHVSDVAPKPTPALPKGSIHIPQSGAEWEKKSSETKKDVKKGADKVEKKGKELKKKVKVWSRYSDES